MSRSGYSEDFDEDFPNQTWFQMQARERAIKGNRGQQFLRDLIAAMDAMPVKHLIAEELQREGAVCALGSVGLYRGMDMAALDPLNACAVGKAFGIAETMAREIVYENDEALGYWTDPETPAQRWTRMRRWAEQNLQTKDAV